MKNFIVKSLFVIFVISLFVGPSLQMRFKIFPKLHLSGVEQTIESPKFSIQTYVNGRYQKIFDSWFSQNYGMREYFIKTINQIYFNILIDTLPNSNVVVGKKGQLYENVYIADYINYYPPIDPSELEVKVKETKKLQDILEERGKVFVLMITPSKAAIYPEYIPDNWMRIKKNPLRNYDSLIPLLDKYNINYVDGHKITMEAKLKNEHAVFPRGGTNWNNLAAYYTAKEVVNKISQLSGKNMVNIDLEKIELKPPVGTDKDLADLLNVWFKPINYLSPYPVYKKQFDSIEYKPTIFMHGASFSEQFINVLKNNGAFSDLELFFYSSRIEFKEGVSDGIILGNTDNIDWDNEVFNKDVFLVEMNEQNIPKIQNGIIQDALHNLKALFFNYENKDFVENATVDGKLGYKIKKGAEGKGTLFLQTDKLKLEPNKEYKLTYKAKGFYALNCDLFPDDLPQFNNVGITDETKEYTATFKSDSANMKEACLRIFIDGLTGVTDKDTYIYDIKLTSMN